MANVLIFPTGMPEKTPRPCYCAGCQQAYAEIAAEGFELVPFDFAALERIFIARMKESGS